MHQLGSILLATLGLLGAYWRTPQRDSACGRRRGRMNPALALTLAMMLCHAAPGRAATPAQVDAAMKKAVDALYRAQKNGNWEVVPVRDTTSDPGFGGVNGRQWGGLTAITTYALLSAGENEKDKRIAAAIDFLVNNPSQGVYASACRCLVWSRIKLTVAEHNAARDDIALPAQIPEVRGRCERIILLHTAGQTGRCDVRQQHEPVRGSGFERDGVAGIRDPRGVLAFDGNGLGSPPVCRWRVVVHFQWPGHMGNAYREHDRRGSSDAPHHPVDAA